MEEPLVSICCISFNHAAYIRKCLEGFLMQETTFKYEILINDDASTDDTQDIIKSYEAKYPEIIKPILHVENQYSKGLGGKMNIMFNFPRAKGKYIAMCEGDDYWTDPFKLQKQVDFLEAHAGFSLACGGFIKKHVDVEEEVIIKSPKLFPKVNHVGFEFDLDDLHKRWLTKTLTVLFRRDSLQMEELKKYRYIRDVHLFYHIMKNGKGTYFQEVFGVYNIHEGGVHSLVDVREKQNTGYNLHKELYLINKDGYTKRMLFLMALRKLKYKLKNPHAQDSFKMRLMLLVESLQLVDSYDSFKKFLKHMGFFVYRSLVPAKDNKS